MPARPANAFDLIVIGACSAGLAAADRAAQLGARTVLIDSHQGAGTQPSWRGGTGWSQTIARCLQTAAVHGHNDWQAALRHTHAEMTRRNEAASARLADAGGQRLRGQASLRGRGTVRLTTDAGRHMLRARQIVLATGMQAVPLAAPGAELACTCDDVLAWESLPASLVIVGGGVAAVELASTLARFGVRVMLLTREAGLLPELDTTLSAAAAQALAGHGVEVRVGAEVVRVERDAGSEHSVAVYWADASAASSAPLNIARAQRVVAALGYVPATHGLGLDAVGVTLDPRGHIAVDRHFRTRARGVYAVGDVCGGPHPAAVARVQGRYVAERLFGKGIKLPDMTQVPTAVFCDPAIAAVGLTEAQARARWPGRPERDTRTAAERIDVIEHRFISLEQRLAGNGMESLIKLVCNARSGRVLGAHIASHAAPEIVQTLAVAVRMGVRLKHLRTTVGLHPTVAEALVTL